jgi:Family of unknown function (DUF6516)
VARAKLLRSVDVFLSGKWRVVIKIWELPTIRAGHQRVRYRLSLISPSGKRVVGYDNHHPKGDHRHFRKTEEYYQYRDPETLIRDFLKDVDTVLSEKDMS